MTAYGGAARCTQQQQVQGQEVAIPGAAQLGHPAGLLGYRDIHYRRFGHSRSSLTVRLVWSPSIYQRVRLCANLPRFDLVGQSRVKEIKQEFTSLLKAVHVFGEDYAEIITGNFSGLDLKEKQRK